MNADFIDINLLPRPVRPAMGGPTWVRLMVPGILMVVLALLLTVGAAYLKLRNDRILAEQRVELQRTSEEVRDFATLMAEVQVLQQQVTTLATQAQLLEGDAERVGQENPALAPFLSAITESLLPRMKITGLVAQGDNRFILRGEAGSDSLVVSYAQALQQRPEIRSVTPRSVEQIGGNAPPSAVRWTLEIER